MKKAIKNIFQTAKGVCVRFGHELFFVSMLFGAGTLFCGCAKAPEATEENGISYAVDAEDSEAAEVLEVLADGTKSAYFSYETDEDGRTWCAGKMQTDSNVLVLDAEVLSETSVDTISRKTAVPDPDWVDKEKVLEVFFDGEENVAESYMEYDEDGLYIGMMKTTGGLLLESADGKRSFAQNFSGGFTYHDKELTSKYKDIELDSGASGGKDMDISENYTAEMAREEAAELLTQITKSDVKVVSCYSWYNDLGDGYYTLDFLPTVDGLPLVENDKELNDDSFVDVSCTVQIGKEGAAFIWAQNCLWKITESDAEEAALSLDDALKLLEEYVQENKIRGNEKLPITVIALSWLVVTDDWKEARFIPVWRFYSTIDDISAAQEADSTVSGVTSICINAIDGSIVRTEY